MAARAPYRSPLRERQTAATREAIVGACRSLLEKGSYLTYAAVAAAAGVQERTVYRHFPTKADLETGLWRWIVENRTGADFSATGEEELVAAMRRSFSGFDAAAPLIKGMLHSSQGLEIRRAQQPARRRMFERCVEAAWPGVTPKTRGRAAAALQVFYSASTWEVLRDLCGLGPGAAADAVELVMRALFESLRAGAEKDAGRHTK